MDCLIRLIRLILIIIGTRPYTDNHDVGLQDVPQQHTETEFCFCFRNYMCDDYGLWWWR